MSPVDFKKWPCLPVEFKGQGPLPSLEKSSRHCGTKRGGG